MKTKLLFKIVAVLFIINIFNLFSSMWQGFLCLIGACDLGINFLVSVFLLIAFSAVLIKILSKPF